MNLCSRLFLTALVLSVTGCSTVPGFSIISDLSDVNTLARSEGNLPVEDVQKMALRPLVQGKGISYDVGLLRRAVAQGLLSDVEGLRQTKALALRNALLDDTKIDVVGALALSERGRMNYRSAIREHEETGRLIKAAASNSQKHVHEMGSLYPFIANYLATASLLNDKFLISRIRSDYLLPISISNKALPVYKLLITMMLDRLDASDDKNRGDEYSKYVGLLKSIESNKPRIPVFAKNNKTAQTLLQGELNLARLTAGNLAISLGLYSEAAEQLWAIKRDVSTDNGRIADGSLFVSELERNYLFAIQDYRAALESLDKTWMDTPPAFKLPGTVFPVHYLSTKAGYLAAAGQWKDAERVIATLPLERRGDSSTAVDYFVGVRAIIYAIQGNPSRYLQEFASMEKKYKALSGTDLGYYYAVAKTILYNRQALATGSLSDHRKAVEGGREMSQTFGEFQKGGFGRVSTLGPLVVQMAKEAYAASASTLLENGSGDPNDLLDAMHLLYFSETDRSIASMMARARTIPGIPVALLRQLQDAQGTMRASQQRVKQLAGIQDLDPGELERAAEVARTDSQRLGIIFDKLREIPQFDALAGDYEPPHLQAMQARLADGEGLAMFVQMTDSTLAMVITKRGYKQRLVNVSEAYVKKLVDRIRNTVKFDAQVQVDAFDSLAASDLYESLFGWDTKLLYQTRSLTVIANGALAAVPFSLLITQPSTQVKALAYRDMPWLIRSVAVAHAPSIRSWYAVTAPQFMGRGTGFIAWAHPAFDGENVQMSSSDGGAVRGALRDLQVLRTDTLQIGLPDDLMQALPLLPETLDEARAIARTLGGDVESSVIYGAAATRTSVLEKSQSGELTKRNVVMFATHGLMPAQVPGLFQPALALSPEKQGDRPSLLLLEDVLSLRLNADWVILSACNTASADKIGGDPLSGLARGFFFAGARGMLVTHWEVESDSATAITIRTIERYASNKTLSRAQALQLTAIDLIEGRNTPRDWSHPVYWAPYALVGNARRSAGL